MFALTLQVDQIGFQHQVKENEKKGESAKDSSHAFGKNIITLIKWSHQFVIQIRSALINWTLEILTVVTNHVGIGVSSFAFGSLIQLLRSTYVDTVHSLIERRSDPSSSNIDQLFRQCFLRLNNSESLAWEPEYLELMFYLLQLLLCLPLHPPFVQLRIIILWQRHDPPCSPFRLA